MDLYNKSDNYLDMEGTCTKCYATYKLLDTFDMITKLGIKDPAYELFQSCPTCVASAYLNSLDTTDNSYKPFRPGPTIPDTRSSGFQNTNTTLNNNQPFQIPVLNSFTKSLAVILSIVSILILCYSLILKYLPQIHLPNFPFYAYVVVFSFLTFFIRVNKGAGAIFAIIIIANFVTPQFRNLFYSYFEYTWVKIIFTLLFINSFVSLNNLFLIFYINFFLPKWGTITQAQQGSATLKAYVPTLLLYFAVMSPFYMGAIKPGGDPTVKVNVVQIDPIFDALTSLTKETADVEIARQYFTEGKQTADLGTIEGLNQSIQFYQQAIELVPKFSTAYAEMAYSYGAIYRILKSVDKKSEESKSYLNKARVSIDAAKVQNPENYTTYAVESIIDFQSDNKKASKVDLDKALTMAGSNGTNERMLQAMAYNEKSKVQILNYLITIRDKINPNSAELHNLLAVKYYEIGNIEKTKEMAERAILLSPKYDEPYFNMALIAKERLEKSSIYNRIIEMKSDYASKAERFKKLINWQYGLKITFWVLFVIFWLRVSYLGVQVNQGKINPEKLGLVIIRNFILFTVIFGSFELYIHYIYPVNSLTHLFPISFPIF
jgi:tetratricopeptide (TPR) repeat protein